MRRAVFAGMAMALLTGCADDIKLENAERVVCYAASAGALMRRYGGEPARFKAWQAFCRHVTWPEIQSGQ